MAVTSADRREELAALRIDRSPEPRRLGLAALLIPLIALLTLFGAAGTAYWRFGDRLQPSIQVKTDSVRVLTLAQASTVLTATGYLESRMQAAVGARVPGRLSQIPVEEGMVVQAGDILAVLEHSDLDAALATRKYAVQQSIAELTEAKNELEQRKRDCARERDVYSRNAGTKAKLEAAETALLAAEARVGALQAALLANEARVSEAEEAIRNMYVFAPFGGTIVSKDAEVGETIMPGGMGAASGRGSVAMIADLNQLEVDTDVKEDYLSQLRRGQPAEVVVDAVSDKKYRGKLREIIPFGDRTRGIVKVKVSILDADEHLFPELSATVHFLPFSEEQSAGESKPQVFLPAAALCKKGEETFVWCVEVGQARRVDIATAGVARDGLIPVAEGLSGGEVVVIDPPKELVEGARVTTKQ